jgi:hypothetical protein
VDVNAFAVAAYHSAYLPVGGTMVEAIVWIRASVIDEPAIDVYLRLWTPLGATLALLREVSPGTRDLRDTVTRLDERTVGCSAGRWTGGARAYQLGVTVPPRAIGDELLAARVVVAAAGKVVGRALVAVAWTDDERLVAASTDSAVDSALSAGVAATDLPTGRSRRPRHLLAAGPPAGAPCTVCGLRPQEGDRFCEACGHELDADGGSEPLRNPAA